MTRPLPTPNEIYAKDLLEKYLISKGITYRFDLKINDAPDGLIEINNERISYDFTLLTLSELMSWYHSKRHFENDKCYRIHIPLEPDLWMKRILKKKNKNVEKYKINSNSTKCWLILHNENNNLPIVDDDPKLISMMSYMAYIEPHDFDSILFLYNKNKSYELFLKGLNRPKLITYDYSFGIPNITINEITSILTNKGINIDLKQIPLIEEIYLKPLDPHKRFYPIE
jgi:hypothetical protein